MTDLRESVARAIWDKDFRPMPAWDEMTWPEKLGYQKMATAALRAIADAGFVIVPREPTEEILGAMLTAHNPLEADHLAGNPLYWMRPAYRPTQRGVEGDGMMRSAAYLRYILFLALAVSVAAGLTWIADEIWQTGVWWG